MKMLKQAVMCLSALALVACGGGGGSAGTSPFVTTPPTTATGAASIDVIASALQVPSGGDQVTVTATVKNVGNVGLGATAVQFSSDSGALTSASAVTTAAGTATAILTAGANRSNRTITVTVTSGTVTGTIALPVTGTTLSYSGVTTVALSGVVQTTVTAVDSKGTAISGLPITVASSLNNTLSAASVTTGAQGSATISYTATNPGTDKLTFTGGGTSLSNSITISAAAFRFSSPAASTSIAVGTKQAVSVLYTSGTAATPQVGKTVAFAATAGVLTVANADKTCTLTTALTGVVTTDGNGIATACVSATSASPATIQATLTNDTVAAQATLPVLFVATVPYKIVLQVTPSALSPNASGSTTQKANVLATVTDLSFNPVSGVTVDFTRCVDPSGGSLSQASAVTSSSGQASVQYIAGPSTTASNGVLLTASVEGATIAQPACAAGAFTADSTNNNAVTNNTASLTVSQSALFIAMGTGNQITAYDTATYQQTWSVYVTDSNGAAVSNVNLTIKVLPVAYWKGSLTFNTVWSRTSANPICANEDINYNGVLDPGEDINGDGKLEPGNVIAVATGTAGATLTTDSTGFASFNLRYAKSYANWVYVNLVASAVVTGTESNTNLLFVAPGAAADYSSQTVAPPGQTSPFGIGTCSQAF